MLQLTFVKVSPSGSWDMRGEHMARMLQGSDGIGNASVATCSSLVGRGVLPSGVYIHVKHPCRPLLGRPGTRHVLDLIDGVASLAGFDALIASTQAQIDQRRLWRYEIHCKLYGAFLRTTDPHNRSLAQAAQNAFCDDHPCVVIPHMGNLPCTTTAEPPPPRMHGVLGLVGSTGDTCSDTRAERKRAFPDALEQRGANGLCELMESIDVAIVWKMSNDQDKPCTRFVMSVLANRPAIIHSFYACAGEIEGAAPFRCNDTACALRTVTAIRNGALNTSFARLRREVTLRNAQIPAMYRAFCQRVSEEAVAHKNESKEI